MRSTTNVYDPSGAITTTSTREGMDIGPRPDFMADLDKLRKKLQPLPPNALQLQSAALANQPGAQWGGGGSGREPEYEANFGVMNPGGGSLGHGWMEGYTGQMLGAGRTPVATGYTRRR